MSGAGIDLSVVREIALQLPDVVESTTFRGASWKLRGKLIACQAIHKSAEPSSLMVRVSFDERARLLAAEPRTYYLTDHYLQYPAVLARLSRLTRNSLRDLLGVAWLFVGEQTKTSGRARQKPAVSAGSKPPRSRNRKH
jgi:hypothetical protein